MISPRIKKSLRVLQILVIIIIAGAIIRFFIVEPGIVRGASMEDSLTNKDLIVINKITPLFKQLERGDVVQIYDKEKNKVYIKRIIGLPNEEIKINGEEVYIKTTSEEFKAVEPYVKKTRITTDKHTKDGTYYTQANEYFVMGDNREQSIDSRDLGSFHRKEIIGKIHLLLAL